MSFVPINRKLFQLAEAENCFSYPSFNSMKITCQHILTNEKYLLIAEHDRGKSTFVKVKNKTYE